MSAQSNQQPHTNHCHALPLLRDPWRGNVLNPPNTRSPTLWAAIGSRAISWSQKRCELLACGQKHLVLDIPSPETHAVVAKRDHTYVGMFAVTEQAQLLHPSCTRYISMATGWKITSSLFILNLFGVQCPFPLSVDVWSSPRLRGGTDVMLLTRQMGGYQVRAPYHRRNHRKRKNNFVT